MNPLQPAVSIVPKWEKWSADMLKRSNGKLSLEALAKIFDDEYVAGETWMNNLYVVILKHHANGGMHLSIRRVDRKPARDWRHFQQIKNQLAGPEREALELYPAESRLVDTANQYHLWVIPEGKMIPVGWKIRSVIGPDEMPIPGAVQRPFNEE